MAPRAEHITTVDDIDEAIWWVLMTAPRKLDYMKIIDALLDQRNAVSQGHPSHPSERQPQTDPPSPDALRQGSPHPSRGCPGSASNR